jgi:hypothetical protein
MARPKTSTRGPRKAVDLTEGIEWIPPLDPVKTNQFAEDGVGKKVPSIDYMARTPAKGKKVNGDQRAFRAIQTIEENWPNILKAAQNGYEMQNIAKAVGVGERTFYKFLRRNPNKKTELVQARLKPRDTCVQVILNAAKNGNWLPAAWWLERTCWQEFARPEVKLQLMDRMMNQNEVVQTFNGKSLQQINQELREKYGDNEGFQRATERVQDGVNAVRSKLDEKSEGHDRSEGGPAVVDNAATDVLD